MDWDLIGEVRGRLYAWMPGEPLVVRGIQLPGRHVVRTPLGTYLAYHVQSVMFLEALGVPRQMMLQFFSNGGEVVYHYTFPTRGRAAPLYITPSLLEAMDVIQQEKLGDVAIQKFKRLNPFEQPPFWISDYWIWRYGPLSALEPETVVAAYETAATGVKNYPPVGHITRGFVNLQSNAWHYAYKTVLRGAQFLSLAADIQIVHYGTAEWVAVSVKDVQAITNLRSLYGDAPYRRIGSLFFFFPSFLKVSKGYELL